MAGADDRGLPFEARADGSLVLTLDGACIQSTAERAHRQLTAALLDGTVVETEVEAHLDLLGQFLHSSDFGGLRAAHPALRGAIPCRVRLCRRSDGAVEWEVVS